MRILIGTRQILQIRKLSILYVTHIVKDLMPENYRYYYKISELHSNSKVEIMNIPVFDNFWLSQGVTISS